MSITSTEFNQLPLIEALALQSQPVQILPLEVDLLLQRIKKNDATGQFLADAFISSYRNYEMFNHSLGELAKLDIDAFRLFHQILHIRFIKNWDDAVLFDIEQQILTVQGCDQAFYDIEKKVLSIQGESNHD